MRKWKNENALSFVSFWIYLAKTVQIVESSMREISLGVWVRYLNDCGREDGVRQNGFVLNSNGPPCLIWKKIGWKCFKLSAFCVTQPSPEGTYFRIFRSFRCFRNHKRHKNDWWTSFPLTRWVSIIAFQREITCAGRTKYYALGAWNDTRTVRTYRHRIAKLKIDIYIDPKIRNYHPIHD